MASMGLAAVVLGLGLGACVAPQASVTENAPIIGHAHESGSTLGASLARIEAAGTLLGLGAGTIDPPEGSPPAKDTTPTAGTLDGILTVLRWALYFVVVVIVVPLGLQRLLRLLPKAGTALVIEDLTTRRDDGDRSVALEKQLAVAVDRLRGRISHGPSHLDAGLPEATAFKRPGAPKLGPDDVVFDTRVSVGPISLSPLKLLKSLTSLLQRPYEHTIEGWLLEDDGTLRLVMESVRRGRSPGCLERWESSGPSKSRAGVVEDAARHVLFVLGKPAFTASRESFVAYCDAMQATDLEVAKKGFQASLQRDPSNWMARLELAELLNRQRRPTAAIAHLDHLARRLAHASHWCPADVAADLRDAVSFNRAAALSMLPILDQRKKALGILERLLVSKPHDGAILAARAAVWLDIGLDDEQELAEITQKLAMEHEAIAEDPPTDPASWGDYSRAVATISSAYAHALLAQGSEDESQIKKVLYEAMAMMPDFLEPYVTLVRLQMESRPRKGRHEDDEHYPNWEEEAEELLMTALTLKPSNEEAHYNLGKLYSLKDVARYDEAKPHLMAAPSIARSHWRLADISHDHDGNIVEALAHMRTSLSLDHTADQRLASFVQWAQELLATKDDPKLREEAKEKARRLAEHGVDERLCKKGTALLEELAQQPKAA